jgi:two-component system, response regulator PdtaR
MNKIRVLVVEDEVIIRLMIVNFLKDFNCEVVSETGFGEKAIEFAETSKPDLILMDIKLQGKINGIEASKKIIEKNKIPIILMSAYDYKDELKKSDLSTIIIDFLEKPISYDRLGETIKKYFI